MASDTATKTTKKASQRPKFNPKSAPGDATGRAREAAQHAAQEAAQQRDNELTMASRAARQQLDEAVDMREEYERSIAESLRLSGVTDADFIAERVQTDYVEVVAIEEIDCFVGPTRYQIGAGQTALVPQHVADQHFAGWLYPY